jgi:hypothetical protein
MWYQMSQWTHPLCEACWISENTYEEVDNPGVTQVRMPVRLIATECALETCCMCGFPTIMGIYVRRDPAEVNFLPEE